MWFMHYFLVYGVFVVCNCFRVYRWCGFRFTLL